MWTSVSSAATESGWLTNGPPESLSLLPSWHFLANSYASPIIFRAAARRGPEMYSPALLENLVNGNRARVDESGPARLREALLPI